MRILIVTGGTGGHTSPALAVVERLREKYPQGEIFWVGGRKEKEIALLLNLPFRELKAPRLPRALSWELIIFTGRFVLSFFEAFLILRQFKPQVVVGMGSFHSFWLIFLSPFLGIPTLSCEQNVTPGLTTLLLLPFVTRIAAGLPPLKENLPSLFRKKVELTGNPLRREVLKIKEKREARKNLGLDPERFTLLFMGGSQGAHFINWVGSRAMEILKEEPIQSIFLTGKRDKNEVVSFLEKLSIPFRVFDFTWEMGLIYSAVDLVITRCGAMALSEILCRGLPSLLIPYPFATRNHQLKNAHWLAKEGAGRVFSQIELTPEILAQNIREIMRDENLRKKISRRALSLSLPGGTERVVRLIEILSPKNDSF